MRKTKTLELEKKMSNSPVDVIHSIKEHGGAISWIHHNTISRDMPIFVQRVMIVDVPPLGCQAMIPLPHIEHFVNKDRKIRVTLENGLKLCIGLLPQWTPRGLDVIGHMKDLIEVVVNRDVHSSVTITIPHHELILQTRNIDVVDWPNKRKTPQATQRNRETRLPQRFKSNLLNHSVRVLFLRSANLELCFSRSLLRKKLYVVGYNMNINLDKKENKT